MTNRRLVLITLLIVIVAITISFIVEQNKYTTYQKVLLEMLGDYEVIQKITIQKKQGEYLSFTTENTQIINSIVKEPSNMVLKKKRETPKVDYFLDIYTNNSEISIFLGKDNLQIWGSNYNTGEYIEGYQGNVNNFV